MRSIRLIKTSASGVNKAFYQKKKKKLTNCFCQFIAN